MKIKISRSFSKKIQLKQYEPIEFFCGAETEYDLPSPVNPERDAQEMTEMSEKLDKFVQSEVEKSANKFKKVDTKKSKDVSKDDAEHDAGNDTGNDIQET